MSSRPSSIALVAASLLLPVQAPNAQGVEPAFAVGRYVRVTKSPVFPAGGRESGLLEIRHVAAQRVTFSLAVTMNPSSADDGFLTRSGEIPRSAFSTQGTRGVYQSQNAEGRELGTCVLAFEVRDKAVTVVQSGKCWWFGEGVNASGTYRLVSGNEPPAVVR